ncbi:MAG: MFS transporter [Rhodanobacteraceae bacterium]|nr:MAG: MFS transporter [Rhodanobacteraceae bacterium]
MSSSHTLPADYPAIKQAAHNRDQDISSGDIAVGVVIGRAVGFFDMFVFGIACVMVFPKVVFPFASEADGVLYSFLVFALGFVGQPLGSMLFLAIQKRYGRGTKLTIALFLLGFTTVGIAFMPDYAELGWITILWLAILRFGQGFAIGGSWNGLASLLALKAPAHRRGWFASIPQLGAPIGFVVAGVMFVFLWANITHAEFFAWGWRYPFFAAFGANLFALFARLRLVVSPEYAKQFEQRDLEPAPLGELMREQGKFVVLGAFAPLASYALFNLITIFALAWALLFTKQTLTSFLVVQIIGAFVAIPCMLASGWIADRIGRRTTLGIFAVLIAVYSGWTALMLAGGTFQSYVFIIVGFALLGFSHAQSAGAVSSSFRSYFRYSGARISSDMSWLIGAGFAPVVALLLARHLGTDYVGLYLLSGAACTLGALWFARRWNALPDD